MLAGAAFGGLSWNGWLPSGNEFYYWVAGGKRDIKKMVCSREPFLSDLSDLYDHVGMGIHSLWDHCRASRMVVTHGLFN